MGLQKPIGIKYRRKHNLGFEICPLIFNLKKLAILGYLMSYTKFYKKNW